MNATTHTDTKSDHDVLDDLNQLDQALAEDSSGERMRAVVDYFEQAIVASQSLMGQVQHQEERLMTSQLIEGFRAAQRIVQTVWDNTHNPATADI